MQPSTEHVADSLAATRKRLFESQLTPIEKKHFGSTLNLATPLQNGHAGDIATIGKAIGRLAEDQVNHVVDHKEADAAFDKRAEQAAERAITNVLGSFALANGGLQVRQVADNKWKVQVAGLACLTLAIIIIAIALVAGGHGGKVADALGKAVDKYPSPNATETQ